MSLKILTYIRNKAQLQILFISQFPAEYIRNEINAIIQITRKSIGLVSKFGDAHSVYESEIARQTHCICIAFVTHQFVYVGENGHRKRER